MTTIPTIGFNVETIDVHGFNMTAFDLSAQSSGYRALWRHYYQNTHGLVFVLDAHDVERIDLACTEFTK